VGCYEDEDDEIVFMGPNLEDWCYDPESDNYYNELLKLKNDTTDMSATQSQLLMHAVFHKTMLFLECTHMRRSCYENWERDLKLHFSKGGRITHYPIPSFIPSPHFLFISQFSKNSYNNYNCTNRIYSYNPLLRRRDLLHRLWKTSY
jgi:hypothetical protein